MSLHKIKFLFIFASLIFTAPELYSQNGFVTLGGNTSGNGGTLSYSVGQLVYKSQTGFNGNINQGVQQPYEIFTVAIAEEFLDISVSIFPNPTLDMLIININDVDSKTLNYQLYDIQGKLLIRHNIFKNQTKITTENLPASTYVLKINSENKPIQSFKIIKN
ncbi:MAG: T9SS type A sorting domain-containing protein [Saprospiraceae bacterium]|nr:T9SS type A sorting domain-containing protein [Candidatus Defluviibacterium haderslevense]